MLQDMYGKSRRRNKVLHLLFAPICIGFNFHPGPTFSLSLCESISITRPDTTIIAGKNSTALISLERFSF